MSVANYKVLSAFYFNYYAVIGVLSPFWGLYLHYLGFSPQQIGVLVAIPMLTKIVAPNCWSSLASYTGNRVLVIQIASAGACLGFIPLLFADHYWLLIFCLLLFSFFHNAIIPLFEVVTLESLDGSSLAYSHIRLWGSVGFIVTVLGVGLLVDVISENVIPVALLVFLVGILFTVMQLPGKRKTEKVEQHQSVLDLIKKRAIWGFFIAVFLLQLSHGMYYGFYSLYLEVQGYMRTLIGILWSVGVIAEIILFLKIRWIFTRFSWQQCFIGSVVIASLRWLLIASFGDNLAVLLFAQLFHAFTFGLLHACAMEFLRQRFKGTHHHHGQAIYSAFSLGCGTGLGAFLAGHVWTLNMHWVFPMAAVMAMLSAIVAYGCGVGARVGARAGEPG